MAGLKTPGNPEKKELKATMYFSHICRETENKYDSVLLTIAKYYQLKPNTVYKYVIDKINWILTIMKEKRCMKIIIFSDDLEDHVTCSLISDNQEVLTSVAACQISKGEYKVELPLKKIEDLGNKSLQEGHLVLQFKFNQKLEVIKCVQACSTKRKCESDKLKLAKDLMAACVTPRFTNFVIKVNDKEINIPKALLAARSKYFEECDEREDVHMITLNTDLEAVHRAIRYMYTGQLPIFNELKEICELLKVAESLKIMNLQTKCVLLAQEFFDKNEVIQITDGIKELRCSTS